MRNMKIVGYDSKTHELTVKVGLGSVIGSYDKAGVTRYILAGSDNRSAEVFPDSPVKGLCFHGQFLIDPTRVPKAQAVASSLDELLAKVFGK